MAQFGRALRSGRRGRGFESRRLDSKETYKFALAYRFHSTKSDKFASVAQLVERLIRNQ